MRLLHSAARVSSREEATRFYQELLGLELLREYEIKPALTEKIFGFSQNYQILLYQLGDSQLELFVGPTGKHEGSGVSHLCIGAGDREELKRKALKMGYRVNEIEREGTHNLLFIYDADGNVFEVKD
jgi:catechol 2,3-dioxygenase-like lactoylglutathione lyase family enzyme